MRVLGVNCLSHDAGVSVVEEGRILYHKKGNGHLLTPEIAYEVKWLKPDVVSFFEKPWLKKTRQLYSGEHHLLLDPLPHAYMKTLGIDLPYVYQSHHESHAATGYYTSGYNHAVVFVFDAIGEWDCTSVWRAEGNSLTKLYSEKYPRSLGLFYSAFTKLLGFKPNSEEHLFYNLSTIGQARYKEQVKKYLHRNVHTGIGDWNLPLDADVAASVQSVFSDKVDELVNRFKGVSGNAVFMGGCAMNAYIKTVGKKFDDFYVYMNPGDVSSSIGAAILMNPQKVVFDNA